MLRSHERDDGRHPEDHLALSMTGVEPAMSSNDRIQFDDGVDDRPQGTMLYGLAKPVERIPLRADEDAVKSLIAVDRLFEIAR